MNQTRRDVLRAGGGAGLWAVLAAAGCAGAGTAVAADPSKAD